MFVFTENPLVIFNSFTVLRRRNISGSKLRELKDAYYSHAGKRNRDSHFPIIEMIRVQKNKDSGVIFLMYYILNHLVFVQQCSEPWFMFSRLYAHAVVVICLPDSSEHSALSMAIFCLQPYWYVCSHSVYINCVTFCALINVRILIPLFFFSFCELRFTARSHWSRDGCKRPRSCSAVPLFTKKDFWYT